MYGQKTSFHQTVAMSASSKENTEATKVSSPPPPSSAAWKERIYVPTLVAGIVGGAAGLVSKSRKVYGAANISMTYATNLAIVTGCYCGAREFVRETRASTTDDLLNSMIGGFASGAVLGRLQGGPIGAVRYSIIFAFAGTVLDYTVLRLRPLFESFEVPRTAENSQQDGKTTSGWKLPEWSPIQVLDEEALAAKQAREQLYEQRVLGKLSKEESQ